jgi:uncharacterized coiled-coil protein SlyX
MEKALTDLQMLVMEQQRSVESMSEQLIAQSRNIALLEKRIALLESRLEQAFENTGREESVADEKPPHY